MAKWSEEVIEKKSAEYAALADKYKGLTNEQLETVYAKLRDDKDELAALEKPLNQNIQVVESIFAERMIADSLKSIRFENGHLITVSLEQSVSIQDKESFIRWMKECGRELELTVYAATANKIAKEQLNENETLPPGMVQGDPVPKISFRRR
jgi:hypothetical protein